MRQAYVSSAKYQMGHNDSLISCVCPAWKASGMLDDVMGGKTTLGAVPGSKFDGLTAMSGDIIGILMGLAFIVIAFVLPERIGGGGVAVPAE